MYKPSLSGGPYKSRLWAGFSIASHSLPTPVLEYLDSPSSYFFLAWTGDPVSGQIHEPSGLHVKKDLACWEHKNIFLPLFLFAPGHSSCTWGLRKDWALRWPLSLLMWFYKQCLLITTHLGNAFPLWKEWAWTVVQGKSSPLSLHFIVSIFKHFLMYVHGGIAFCCFFTVAAARTVSDA